MRAATILAVLLGTSAPAGAECLDATDLGRGVVATFANGDATTMRRIADGTVQFDETYADGSPPMRLRADRGIYVVEEYELDAQGAKVPGTGLAIVFPDGPAALPEPAPRVAWTGETVNAFDDGWERIETTTVKFAAADPLDIGGCTYPALVADLRYDWGAEGGVSLRYLYLPGLGVAIIQSTRFDGEAARETVLVDLRLATK